MIATRQKITPVEYAARLGVDPHKILAWIRSGELHAINAATSQAGRSRFLIDERDIELFERRRATDGPVQAPRRRRVKNPEITEFF